LNIIKKLYGCYAYYRVCNMKFVEKAFLEEGFSLDRLRRLVEVEKHGYIAKAAGGDRILANQISRQIGELENFFGKELRRKDGKLAKLNDRGVELAGITNLFFKKLDEFQSALDGERPSVVIGAGQAYIESFLIPKLADIKTGAGNAGISLRNMRSNQILDALGSGEIEMGVLSETKKIGSKLIKSNLLTFGYELVVPKKFIHLVNKRNPLNSIFDLPFATLLGRGELRETIEKFASKEKRKLFPELECTSLGQIATAVRSGVCCGLLPDYFSEHETGSSVIRYKSGKLNTLKRTISLVWIPASPLLKPYLDNVVHSVRKAFST
jgi:DNA-binding transcriptional LysR family regulator